jgi:nodulation protein E
MVISASEDAVVVTGLGAVTAAGAGVAALWKACAEGHRNQRVQLFSGPADVAGYEALVAPVPEGSESTNLSERLLMLARRHDRGCHFALSAIAEALAQARLAGKDHDLEDAGLIWSGSATSSVVTDAAYTKLFLEKADRLSPLTVPLGMASATASLAALAFGVGGASFSVGSACASSAHAVAVGAQLLQSGAVSRAIVGGSELSCVYGSIAAWSGAPVLSRTGCWPFQERRDGIVLGEGAGALVLERLSDARARGAPILASLLQAESTTGSKDVVSPDERAIRRLLARIRVPQGASRLVVNAHATGTKVGDETEARVLCDWIEQSQIEVRVSATKPTTGHTLGASGAIEAVVSVASLQHGVAPGRFEQQLIAGVPGASSDETEFVPDLALSNSFGFGGANCALLFGRV